MPTSIRINTFYPICQVVNEFTEPVFFLPDNFKNKGGNLARFGFLALRWTCKVCPEVHIYIKRGFMIEVVIKPDIRRQLEHFEYKMNWT